MQVAPQVHTDDHIDDLAERFFSEPPQAWEDGTAFGWQPRVLSARQSMAIVATAVPIVLGAVAALCLLLFSDRGPRPGAGVPGENPLELASAATPALQDHAVQ